MRETFEQLVARVNRNAFLPTIDPTGSRSSIMAKPVKLGKGKEFTFAAPKSGGGETKYPWDAWFNGDLLLLERSSGPENEKGTIEVPNQERDYGVPTNSMPPKINTAARRRYKVVQISRQDADGKKLKDALIIRARDMDAAERADEDILRAEEKEEAKARKANAVVVANGQAITTAPTDGTPAV